MKKLICVALVAAFAACATFAEQATLTTMRSEPSGCMSDWTPFRISLAGPAALPWGNWNIKGLDVGIWNDSEEMDGLEIGVVNTAYRMRGLQIGAINIARNAYGLQIGVINVIRTNDIPFFPVINWYF
mgnify:CR=1 FL=1